MSTVLKNSESKYVERNKGNNNEFKTNTTNRSVKPVILSSQRFNKIVNNATTTDNSKALAEAAEEQKYNEQSKVESDKLVVQFRGNMQRTQEQKRQQIKEQADKKNKQAISNYEHAKENEAKKRREKIAKAEQIMERLKPGPRELHSAFLQSEVLRARNVQRSINEEFEKVVKKQDQASTENYFQQSFHWIGEEQQRLNERQVNNVAYRKELLRTINENQTQRSEQKKESIREQQTARFTADSETKAKMEKERAIMEKKKEVLRKNALEAMKMVEQRRLRDRMVDGLEDRLCGVYNAGKSKLDALRNEQTKKLIDEKQQKIDAEVRNLNNLEDNTKAVESDRIRRDITTMQLKFTAEEQEKVRKDKAAKQARIEAYLKEMQFQKEMEQKIKEEKQFEVAQRLKNAEVNRVFSEKQREEKLKQFQNVRSQLNQQIEDDQKQKLAQKQPVEGCSNHTLEKEHKYFFEHARNLMEDAQQKQRPLYPFVKVVNQYKRDNQIDCNRKVARHLQSNVPIGEKPKKSSLNDEKNENQNILQNCVKINEIIKKAANSAHDETITLENVSAADGATAPCTSHTLRYSMDELKKINKFSAPTCH